MGVLASEHPKCMTELRTGETILSRQLEMLAQAGIREAVMTTGPFESLLANYCRSLDLPIHITYVKNPVYRNTNYIYSIYCARECLDDDIILMHGDLVFENEAFDRILDSDGSCMAVSSSMNLSEKDFKVVIRNGQVDKIGTEFFTDALAAQPIYRLDRDVWRIWMDKIVEFCESGEEEKQKCYAEDALNLVSDRCGIRPLDLGSLLCAEIDSPDDLAVVSGRLHEIGKRTVYICFSTDILHSGHIRILKRAGRLGRVMVGVLSDEAVASYKRCPLLPSAERKAMFESMAGVWRVVEQESLSYVENIRKYRPDYVVHGDYWKEGFLRRSVRRLWQRWPAMAGSWWSSRMPRMKNTGRWKQRTARGWQCRT